MFFINIVNFCNAYMHKDNLSSAVLEPNIAQYPNPNKFRYIYMYYSMCNTFCNLSLNIHIRQKQIQSQNSQIQCTVQFNLTLRSSSLTIDFAIIISNLIDLHIS